MLDRKRPPEFRTPEFSNIPSPVQEELSSGVNVYTFPSFDQDVFKIELNFSVGSAAVSNPAIALLCMALLREGTATKTAEEINSTLDYYGAFLNIKPSLEMISITLYGRSVYINELIPLLGDIINNPVFDESALEKHSKKSIQRLTIDQSKTNYWAPRMLRRNLYGEKHTYGRFLNIDNYAKVSREDLVDFHTNYLLKHLHFIITAGAIKAENIHTLLNKHFGRIAQKNRSQDDKALLNKGIITAKKLPEANQASIALGLQALPIQDKSYPEYAFITKVLGGYFGSRLMKKLREEEGLTYGIHAYIVHLRNASYLQISADIKLSSVDKGIELILEEINKLSNELILERELQTVKNYMLGEFVNDTNTAFDFADLHKKLLLHRLPSDYYETFYQKVTAITAIELSDLAKTHLPANSFSIAKAY